MEIVFMIFFFVFGTIIGSFLNVVIFRYNSGAGFGGRSKCFSCNKEISWYDLVPFFSFIFLSGRCRHCKSKISFQYPTVEMFAGLIFTGVFLKMSPLLENLDYSGNLFMLQNIFILSDFFSTLIFFSLMLVIAVYDLRHKIIPDMLVFLSVIVGLVRFLAINDFSILFQLPQVLDLLAGPLLALPLFLIWFVSSGKWIGLGDAKLTLATGWFLGFFNGLSGLVIGFWVGAIISIILLIISRFSRTLVSKKILLFFGLKSAMMKSEIPLGPFLIIGVLVVYFFEFDVFGLNNLFLMYN